MPNDPIQAIEFAQSKGQARKDGKTGVLFTDVAGCDEALRKLGYVVEARARPAGSACWFPTLTLTWACQGRPRGRCRLRQGRA